MKFKVDIEQIKTRELVEAEESLKKALKLMSRFMVDEVGNAIPEDEAYDKLLDLNIVEQQNSSEAFANSILPSLKGRRSSAG
jgi:hypothetical protein